MSKYFRCNRCFAPWEDDWTVCKFCGHNPKEDARASKPRKMVCEEITEDDIDTMFRELEERLDKQDGERRMKEPDTKRYRQPMHSKLVQEKSFEEMTLDEVIEMARSKR